MKYHRHRQNEVISEFLCTHKNKNRLAFLTKLISNQFGPRLAENPGISTCFSLANTGLKNKREQNKEHFYSILLLSSNYIQIYSSLIDSFSFFSLFLLESFMCLISKYCVFGFTANLFRRSIKFIDTCCVKGRIDVPVSFISENKWKHPSY